MPSGSIRIDTDLCSLLVLECADDEEYGHYKTEDEGDDNGTDRGTCYQTEDCSQYSENCRDDTPCEAEICLFGFLAVSNADDTCYELCNACDESEDNADVCGRGRATDFCYSVFKTFNAREAVADARCNADCAECYDCHDDSDRAEDYHQYSHYFEETCSCRSLLNVRVLEIRVLIIGILIHYKILLKY